MHNAIKDVCTELDITYYALAKRLGIAFGTIKNSASKKKISDQILAGIDLVRENHRLKKELKDYLELKEVLKQLIKD